MLESSEQSSSTQVAADGLLASMQQWRCLPSDRQMAQWRARRAPIDKGAAPRQAADQDWGATDDTEEGEANDNAKTFEDDEGALLAVDKPLRLRDAMLKFIVDMAVAATPSVSLKSVKGSTKPRSVLTTEETLFASTFLQPLIATTSKFNSRANQSTRSTSSTRVLTAQERLRFLMATIRKQLPYLCDWVRTTESYVSLSLAPMHSSSWFMAVPSPSGPQFQPILSMFVRAGYNRSELFNQPGDSTSNINHVLSFAESFAQTAVAAHHIHSIIGGGVLSGSDTTFSLGTAAQAALATALKELRASLESGAGEDHALRHSHSIFVAKCVAAFMLRIRLLLLSPLQLQAKYPPPGIALLPKTIVKRYGSHHARGRGPITVEDIGEEALGSLTSLSDKLLKVPGDQPSLGSTSFTEPLFESYQPTHNSSSHHRHHNAHRLVSAPASATMQCQKIQRWLRSWHNAVEGKGAGKKANKVNEKKPTSSAKSRKVIPSSKGLASDASSPKPKPKGRPKRRRDDEDDDDTSSAASSSFDASDSEVHDGNHTQSNGNNHHHGHSASVSLCSSLSSISVPSLLDEPHASPDAADTNPVTYLDEEEAAVVASSTTVEEVIDDVVQEEEDERRTKTLLAETPDRRIVAVSSSREISPLQQPTKPIPDVEGVSVTREVTDDELLLRHDGTMDETVAAQSGVESALVPDEQQGVAWTERASDRAKPTAEKPAKKQRDKFAHLYEYKEEEAPTYYINPLTGYRMSTRMAMREAERLEAAAAVERSKAQQKGYFGSDSASLTVPSPAGVTPNRFLPTALASSPAFFAALAATTNGSNAANQSTNSSGGGVTNIAVLDGPTGSGKTMIALAAAMAIRCPESELDQQTAEWTAGMKNERPHKILSSIAVRIVEISPSSHRRNAKGIERIFLDITQTHRMQDAFSGASHVSPSGALGLAKMHSIAHMPSGPSSHVSVDASADAPMAWANAHARYQGAVLYNRSVESIIAKGSPAGRHSVIDGQRLLDSFAALLTPSSVVVDADGGPTVAALKQGATTTARQHAFGAAAQRQLMIAAAEEALRKKEQQAAEEASRKEAEAKAKRSNVLAMMQRSSTTKKPATVDVQPVDLDVEVDVDAEEAAVDTKKKKKTSTKQKNAGDGATSKKKSAKKPKESCPQAAAVDLDESEDDNVVNASTPKPTKNKNARKAKEIAAKDAKKAKIPASTKGNSDNGSKKKTKSKKKAAREVDILSSSSSSSSDCEALASSSDEELLVQERAPKAPTKAVIELKIVEKLEADATESKRAAKRSSKKAEAKLDVPTAVAKLNAKKSASQEQLSEVLLVAMPTPEVEQPASLPPVKPKTTLDRFCIVKAPVGPKKEPSDSAAKPPAVASVPSRVTTRKDKALSMAKQAGFMKAFLTTKKEQVDLVAATSVADVDNQLHEQASLESDTPTEEVTMVAVDTNDQSPKAEPASPVDDSNDLLAQQESFIVEPKFEYEAQRSEDVATATSPSQTSSSAASTSESDDDDDELLLMGEVEEAIAVDFEASDLDVANSAEEAIRHSEEVVEVPTAASTAAVEGDDVNCEDDEVWEVVKKKSDPVASKIQKPSYPEIVSQSTEVGAHSVPHLEAIAAKPHSWPTMDASPSDSKKAQWLIDNVFTATTRTRNGHTAPPTEDAEEDRAALADDITVSGQKKNEAGHERQKLLLVLLEAGDVAAEDEAGFYSTVRKVSADSKVPVLVTTNLSNTSDGITAAVSSAASEVSKVAINAITNATGAGTLALYMPPKIRQATVASSCCVQSPTLEQLKKVAEGQHHLAASNSSSQSMYTAPRVSTESLISIMARPYATSLTLPDLPTDMAGILQRNFVVASLSAAASQNSSAATNANSKGSSPTDGTTASPLPAPRGLQVAKQPPSASLFLNPKLSVPAASQALASPTNTNAAGRIPSFLGPNSSVAVIGSNTADAILGSALIGGLLGPHLSSLYAGSSVEGLAASSVSAEASFLWDPSVLLRKHGFGEDCSHERMAWRQACAASAKRAREFSKSHDAELSVISCSDGRNSASSPSISGNCPLIVPTKGIETLGSKVAQMNGFSVVASTSYKTAQAESAVPTQLGNQQQQTIISSAASPLFGQGVPVAAIKGPTLLPLFAQLWVTAAIEMGHLIFVGSCSSSQEGTDSTSPEYSRGRSEPYIVNPDQFHEVGKRLLGSLVRHGISASYVETTISSSALGIRMLQFNNATTFDARQWLGQLQYELIGLATAIPSSLAPLGSKSMLSVVAGDLISSRLTSKKTPQNDNLSTVNLATLNEISYSTMIRPNQWSNHTVTYHLDRSLARAARSSDHRDVIQRYGHYGYMRGEVWGLLSSILDAEAAVAEEEAAASEDKTSVITDVPETAIPPTVLLGAKRPREEEQPQLKAIEVAVVEPKKTSSPAPVVPAPALAAVAVQASTTGQKQAAFASFFGKAAKKASEPGQHTNATISTVTAVLPTTSEQAKVKKVEFAAPPPIPLPTAQSAAKSSASAPANNKPSAFAKMLLASQQQSSTNTPGTVAAAGGLATTVRSGVGLDDHAATSPYRHIRIAAHKRIQREASKLVASKVTTLTALAFEMVEDWSLKGEEEEEENARLNSTGMLNGTTPIGSIANATLNSSVDLLESFAQKSALMSLLDTIGGHQARYPNLFHQSSSAVSIAPPQFAELDCRSARLTGAVLRYRRPGAIKTMRLHYSSCIDNVLDISEHITANGL